MSDYNKLRVGVIHWTFLYSSTTSDAHPYDYTSQTANASSDPGVSAGDYLPEDIVRADDGSLPATFYWYKNIVDSTNDFNIGGIDCNCVAIDDTIYFGKMPTISFDSVTYNESEDRIEFILNSPNLNWGIGTWTVKAELDDSTPDNNVALKSASSTATTTVYINDAEETYGSGTFTLYVRFYYNGVYSNIINQDVTITSSNEWVLIDTVSSDPGTEDVYIEDSGAMDSSYAQSILETAYPASNRTTGDVGVVYDADITYYIFEVQ